MNVCSRLGLLAVASLLSLSGCTADIGDSCSTSLNCSQSGDRVCDTSLPGGYCTVPHCEPDTCPSEAGCIAFRQYISTHSACKDPNDTRMIRTYCMVHCSSNSDCRNGYVCADMNAADNPWGASVTDRNNRDGRVCIVSVSSENASGPAGYCQWSDGETDAGFPVPYDAGREPSNARDASSDNPEPPDASVPDAS